LAPGQEHVRQSCQHIDLAAVHGDAEQSGFLKAELIVEHPERVFNLRADTGLLQAEACG
jgi:hypothetical protein